VNIFFVSHSKKPLAKSGGFPQRGGVRGWGKKKKNCKMTDSPNGETLLTNQKKSGLELREGIGSGKGVRKVTLGKAKRILRFWTIPKT